MWYFELGNLFWQLKGSSHKRPLKTGEFSEQRVRGIVCYFVII